MCTFAFTIWPSLSILSILAVGKKGRLSQNDLDKIHKSIIIICIYIYI